MSGINLFFLIVLLWLSAFHALAQNNKNEVYSIKGIVTQTSSFCGGMPPKKEMIQELQTPKPIIEKKLFVKKGKKNLIRRKIVKEILTDSSGHFSLSLPAGTYCIVEDYKTKKFESSEKSIKEIKCAEKQWSQCDYTFCLPEDHNKTIKINYHHYCDGQTPCDTENKTNVPAE